MGKTGFNRRSFLGAGGATLALPMLSSGVFAAGSVDIRAVWWGGDERGRRTNAAIKAFMNANPGISVEAETMGWDDYWARLATQVAGGNAPDFIQMDYRYMAEYARRGAIRPLDNYLGNELQIEDFGAANLESCSVDGKLYGGNVGVNSFG
ncbi:MAG: extracellular solute-binding protein, partial [Maritimibacter sp.]